MRILMFPQRPFPCDHAMLESVYARILPERGHEVHWVMRAADHDPARPSRQWHGSTVLTVPRGPESLIGNVRTALREFAALGRRPRVDLDSYDVVQVRNEIGASLAALVRSESRRRFVFVYQMSFPSAEFRLSSARRGELTPALYHNLRARAEMLARRRILAHADGVLPVSDTLRAQLLAGDDRLDPGRVVTFPLGFDASVVPDRQAAEAARRALGLDGRPLAVYFGTLSSARRLDFLAEALMVARREVPRLALLIIGGDGDQRSLGRAFEAAGIGEGVVFAGFLPRSETARLVASTDVSLVPMPPTPELVSTSPTKLMESLGLGVPVVANEEIPESRFVVGSSGGGLLAPYEASVFGAAIARLATDRGLRAQCAASGREWIIRHREYHVLAAKIERLYQTLLDRRVASRRRDPHPDS